MSIKHDRIAAFYDAVRALTYKEMTEVADEISAFLRLDSSGLAVATALVDASDGKPSNKVTTRGE